MVFKIIRAFMWVILGFFLFILCLIFISWILTMLPVNSTKVTEENKVVVYVKSNGVHTDLVLPVKNHIKDWTLHIHPGDFNVGISSFQYISFGWGDKGFYLNTPTWADLKFSTAFKAMFWLGTAALHVTYHDHTPVENKSTRKLMLTAPQYQRLVEHITSSFEVNDQHQYILIPGHHYESVNDNFYEAKGVYSLFYTCNTWTNNGLKKAGVKTASWALSEWSVMYHLK